MQRNNVNKKTMDFSSSSRKYSRICKNCILRFKRKESNHLKKEQNGNEERIQTFYEKNIKRGMDVLCSLLALAVFWWLYLIIAFLVRIKHGSPVLFRQIRPGKDEKLFELYKFRTMTNERDENGDLLPDEIRLTAFGKALRKTSLDELPEVFNILKGDMSIIGPRPQLVRDMIFMTERQRKRHLVRPGLSGLAQVNGRNDIDWEEKLNWDLKYIEKITFMGDMKIILQTVIKAFIRQEGINEKDMATAEDYGDYLLRGKKITFEEYNENQTRAKEILELGYTNKSTNNDQIFDIPFSVIMSVYKNDNPIFFDRALASITEQQTILPSEIILVVDGPVNNGIDTVIEKYENKYSFFNTIRLKKNVGLGNALKIALSNTKNELIARMDSDDISSPSRFEEQLSIFSTNHEIDIVGGDITEFIGDEKNIVGRRSVPTLNHEIREYMKKRCAMNHMSVMYKKSSVMNAGGYQDWFFNEDYYLWIRMCISGAMFANTGTVLVNVRVGDEMYQRRGGMKYFKSEIKLQKYMLEHQMIGYITYAQNIIKRFIVQIMLPNKLRGWVYTKFARERY